MYINSKAWAGSCIVTFALSLGGCSGSSGGTALPGNESSFADLIVTKRDAVNPEIWACLGADGLLYGYTFYDRGVVEDFDAYMGLGVVLLDDAPTFAFNWSVSDDLSTLYLDSLPTASRDIWTDVSFGAGDRMQATSGSVGLLECSKKSREQV